METSSSSSSSIAAAPPPSLSSSRRRLVPWDASAAAAGLEAPGGFIVPGAALLLEAVTAGAVNTELSVGASADALGGRYTPSSLVKTSERPLP